MNQMDNDYLSEINISDIDQGYFEDIEEEEEDTEEETASIQKEETSDTSSFQKLNKETGLYEKCKDAQDEKDYMKELKALYDAHLGNSEEDKEVRKNVLNIIFYNMENLIYQRIRHKVMRSHERHDSDKFTEYLSYAILSIDVLFRTYEPERSKLSTYLYRYLHPTIVKLSLLMEKKNESDTEHHINSQRTIKKAVLEMAEEYGINKEQLLFSNKDEVLWEISKRTGLSVKVIKREIEYIKLDNYHDNIIINNEGQEESIFDHTANDDDVERQLEDNYRQQKLIDAMSILNKEELLICKLYYGIDSIKVSIPNCQDKHGKPMHKNDIMTQCEKSFPTMSNLLGMSVSKLKKIEATARGKLKKKILNDPDFYTYIGVTYPSTHLEEQIPMLILPDETILADFEGLFNSLDFSYIEDLADSPELYADDEEYEIIIGELPDILKNLP